MFFCCSGIISYLCAVGLSLTIEIPMLHFDSIIFKSNGKKKVKKI